MTRNVGKRTEQEWHDSFLAMEERYLSLKKMFNAQEEALRLVKAEGRRVAGPGAKGQQQQLQSNNRGASSSRQHEGLNTSNVSNNRTSQRPPPLQAFQENRPHSVASVAVSSVAHPKAVQTSPLARHRELNHASTSPLKSPQRPQSRAKVASSNTSHLHQQPQHVPGYGDDASHGLAPYPESMMVWGSEQAMQHAVQCNALMQMNDELRNRLSESDARTKQLEHDLSTCRQVVSGLQTTLDENRAQAHQLVRQRDLAEQKLSNASHQVMVQQEATAAMASEHDKVRFTLDSQIKDLRSRLMLASDNGDALSKDVRGMLSELREKNALVAGLQSNVRVVEASLSSQRSTNESILVELRSLNEQLISERKKVLGLSRDLQVAQLARNRVVELEQQVQALVEQRSAVESESLRMVTELTDANTAAFRHASDDMKDRLGAAERGVAHWQHVAELLYREVGEKTAAHVNCRGECDDAKRERDSLDLCVKSLQQELQLCQAKLEIVWPSNQRDTMGMDLPTIMYAYKANRQKVAHTAETSFLPRSDVPAEEQVLELQEANKFLVAEIEVMRTTNGLLTERLHALLHNVEDHKKETTVLATRHDMAQDAGRRIVSQQSDRIRFLEQQVQSMKGVKVSPNISLQEIGVLENVLEVFVGQLLAAQVALEGKAIPDFSLYFCTVDFLIHETVTTPAITGLSGFLDTTVSYRAAMDSLLVYFLRTRGIVVQLNRIRGTGGNSNSNSKAAGEGGDAVDFELVAEGFASLWDLVSGDRLRDQRPSLRSHIPLYAVAAPPSGNAANGHLVASLEFSVTARAPFSQHFVSLCVSAAEQSERQAFEQAADQRQEADQPNSSRLSLGESQLSAGPSVSLAHVGGSKARKGAELTEPPASISIAVTEVALHRDLASVPRLSCYYAVTALQADASVGAPSKAQYVFQYPPDEANRTFETRTVNDVLALMREPVAFFFFDESSTTPQTHWAIAVWDLAGAMTSFSSSANPTQQPLVVKEILSLTSSLGHRVGEVSVTLQVTPRSSSIAAPVKPREPETAIQASEKPVSAGPPLLRAPISQQQTAAAAATGPAIRPSPPPPRLVVAAEQHRTLDEEHIAQQLAGGP